MLPREYFPDEKTWLTYLRDWFAGQALPVLIANEVSIEPHIADREARLAYAIADAMLKARQEES